MPRRARMYTKGLPYHIVQRGNNREACFIVGQGQNSIIADIRENRVLTRFADFYSTAPRHRLFVVANPVRPKASKSKRVGGSGTGLMRYLPSTVP